MHAARSQSQPVFVIAAWLPLCRLSSSLTLRTCVHLALVWLKLDADARAYACPVVPGVRYHPWPWPRRRPHLPGPLPWQKLVLMRSKRKETTAFAHLMSFQCGKAWVEVQIGRTSIDMRHQFFCAGLSAHKLPRMG